MNAHNDTEPWRIKRPTGRTGDDGRNNAMCESDLIKEQREYAWKYFQLHASQRMSSFNYFVTTATFLTASLVAVIKTNYLGDRLSMFLGVGLCVVSFIFWKLDQRTRHLIWLAEAALKKLEEQWSEDSLKSGICLFTCEEMATKEKQKKSTIPLFTWHLSYSHCFSSVYVIFAIVGFVGIVLSIM